MLIKNRSATKAINKRYIYAQDGQLLLSKQGNWLHTDASQMAYADWFPEPLLVAEWAGEDIYLEVIAEHLETPLTPYHGREMMSQLTGSETDLLGRALQLSHWLKDHQYCGRCGHGNKLLQGEYGMGCPACGHKQYPRLSPCIIVAVNGPNGVLLGHNKRFPAGRYSVLAGFVEAGETVEAAVHREVLEEVGISITNLRYIDSQSWSFPHSLMLGFLADYKAGDIKVDNTEIDHADWFQQDNLPDLPPSFSIARQLIELALKKQTKA